MSRKENAIQALKFLLFSISAGVIQVVSFTLIQLITGISDTEGWAYWCCYLPSLLLSVIWNFTFNREFTFKSATNVPRAMLKVALFYCVFTPLSTWWGQALANIGWNEYIILGGTMVINFVTEFLFCRFVVFRNSINTNKRAKKAA